MHINRFRIALLLAVSFSGCGGSSDKTAPFVGPWTVTSGTLTAMCGIPIPAQSLSGQQTITRVDDKTVSLAILPGCNVTMDVAGSVATLRATTPPQMCMFPFMLMGTSIPVTATFSAGNFTVNGATATFSYTGNAMAGPLNCMVTGTGMSAKGAIDAGTPTADAGAPAADTGSPADVVAPADTATTDTVAPADTATPSDSVAPADTGTATDTVPAADGP